MSQVHIALEGCDDTTYFSLEATSEERAFLERMVEAAKAASTYNCQPTISIEETAHDE